MSRAVESVSYPGSAPVIAGSRLAGSVTSRVVGSTGLEGSGVVALRLLIDATAIPADRGGVGRYVDALVPALVATGEVGVTVACGPADADGFSAAGAEVVEVARASSRGRRMWWEQTGLPTVLARQQTQVLHSPHYTMPAGARCPVVVTLHDATFFSDPQLHSAIKARFFRAATRRAVRRAGGLVVPSIATREELVRFVGPRAARAVVAHHGVDRDIFAPPSTVAIAQVRARLDLGEQPYIAFLGTIEPRKNVPALIAGWQIAAGALPEPPVLVLAGATGWDDRVDPALAAVPGALRVVRPGYLPLDQLAALLGGAEVVAYPALGEGFGLPVLEAMACGAAVLTTRRLALPEVGGDAVAYAEPDAAAIGARLTELLASPRLRAELRARAVQRAAGFTWAAAAEQHLLAYRAAFT